MKWTVSLGRNLNKVMNRTKDLEAQGYETFVCPSLVLIEQKGKELYLNDETIKMAKDLANRYLKKTYHFPHYTHIKYLLPSFIYIASILSHDKRSQNEITEAFGITLATIRKWNEDIANTLDLEILL